MQQGSFSVLHYWHHSCNPEHLFLHICHVLFDLQGFHSSDSDDQHSDDEEDHVEGMSGDEQMGEQQDFEGSDSFDEVCNQTFGGTHFPKYTVQPHNSTAISMMLQALT